MVLFGLLSILKVEYDSGTWGNVNKKVMGMDIVNKNMYEKV